MADQLNMGGLSMGDSQHAGPNGMRSTYIPPHLRGSGSGPPPPGPPGHHGAGGMSGSAWADP